MLSSRKVKNFDIFAPFLWTLLSLNCSSLVILFHNGIRWCNIRFKCTKRALKQAITSQAYFIHHSTIMKYFYFVRLKLFAALRNNFALPLAEDKNLMICAVKMGTTWSTFSRWTNKLISVASVLTCNGVRRGLTTTFVKTLRQQEVVWQAKSL